MALQRSAVALYIIIFLLTGTFSVVVTKFLFQTEAEGTHGTHKFDKPWALNLSMFSGMTLCIPWDFYNKYRKRQSEKRNAMSRRISTNGSIVSYGTTGAGAATEQVTIPDQEEETSFWKLLSLVFVPALCDFSSTYLMYVGMIYIAASVWQMLRGSIVVFTAIIRLTLLKKKTANFEWAGVFIVVIGLIMVGCSDLMSGNAEGGGNAEMTQRLMAFGLVLLAQLIQALQTVVEERLLHDVKASSAIIVGIEGLWGVIMCGLVAIPIAQMLPGTDGEGIHEDSYDTWAMINNSSVILTLLSLYIGVILFFNLFGMYITEVTQSTTRNIMESIRIATVWLTSVCLYYWYSTSYGEGLSYWSLLELGGFLTLVVGLFTYYQIVRLPCLQYPIEFSRIVEVTDQNDK